MLFHNIAKEEGRSVVIVSHDQRIRDISDRTSLGLKMGKSLPSLRNPTRLSAIRFAGCVLTQNILPLVSKKATRATNSARRIAKKNSNSWGFRGHPTSCLNSSTIGTCSTPTRIVVQYTARSTRPEGAIQTSAPSVSNHQYLKHILEVPDLHRVFATSIRFKFFG